MLMSSRGPLALELVLEGTNSNASEAASAPWSLGIWSGDGDGVGVVFVGCCS